MGQTCCGYSLSSNKMTIYNPQELQNNIKECVEKTSNSHIQIKKEDFSQNNNNIMAIKKEKDKYEAFEVLEAVESSNLPSQDQVNLSNANNNNQNAVVLNKMNEKGKSKENIDVSSPEMNNVKIHIDLSHEESPEPSELRRESMTKEKLQKTKSTANVNVNNVKKEKKNNHQLINLNEIKLSDETQKKLNFLKEKSDKPNGQNAKSPNAFKRSKTINANALDDLNNESEFNEPTEKTKKIEEIKLEFLEDRKKLEKKHSAHKKPSGKVTNRSIKNDGGESSSPNNNEKSRREEMKKMGSMSPKKSLLKRSNTIGEQLKNDKNKKKVKFKDVDNKGKKKRR